MNATDQESDGNHDQIQKQDYRNLINCVVQNTSKLPIQKIGIDDEITETFPLVDLNNAYQIHTNIKIQEAGLFKTFNPESLNDALFNNANILKRFGRIRCLTSKNDYLAVGSNLGAVLNFYIGPEPPKNFVEIKREENKKTFSIYALEVTQSDNGSVNQICFNQSATQLTIGYDNGALGIFDLVKNKNIKWIKNIHQQRVISLTYINDNIVCSCDEGGSCFITRIQKGTFLYDVDSYCILKQQPISFIQGLHQSLKPYFQLWETTIFALANGTKCWLLRVQDNNVNQVSTLWELVNENPTTNQCLIEFSEIKQHNQSKLVLGIAWPDCERTYILQGMGDTDKGLKANFKLNKELKQQQNLIYMSCVYNNLIMLISEKGDVYTTNTTNESIQFVMNISKFDIIPLMYWRDNKYESQFNGCISHNEKVKEIYYLADSYIGVLKYYNFEDTFRHFLEQNQYQLCFQILLCVKRKLLMEVNEQLLFELTEQVISLYVKVIAKLYMSDMQEEAKQRSIALCQFLFTIEAEKLLLTFFDLLNRFLNDEGKFFITIIEPFIYNQQVKFLPNEIMLRIFQNYKSSQQTSKITLLLNQLDILRVNQGVYLQACLENSLFKPMIRLCLHPSKNEFLTPLFQIWNYSLQKQQTDNFEEEIQFSLKAIAYINFLLQGKFLNGDPIPQSTLFSMIEMMLVWIFEEQNLLRLITIEPFGTFEMLYHIFQLTTQHLIEFSHKENMQIIDQLVKPYLNPSYKHHFTKINMMGSKQVVCELSGKENYEIEAAYSYFLLRLMLILKLKTKFDEIMQVLLFSAFNQSFLFFIDYRAYAEVVSKQELELLEKHHSHKNIIEYFQQKLMIKLTKIVEDCAETKEQTEQAELLNSFSVLTQIPLVQAHLFAKRGEYIRPISAFLNSENPLISRSVFKYLQEYLTKLNNQSGRQQFRNLNEAVLQRMIDLVQMDVKSTRDIIFTFQKSNEEAVLEQFKQFPKIELEYIETIIQYDSQSGIKIENSILKKHIHLLCQQRPQDVLQCLKSMDYPLDDALQICQEFKNLEATAYILERTGSILQAIELHVEMLNLQLNQILVKLKSFDFLTNNEISEFGNKMNEIVNVCIKNNKFDGSEDNWYYLLDCLLEMINQSNSDSTTQIRDILIKKVGTLLEDISVYTSLELFGHNLKDRYSHLPIVSYKSNFIKILNNFYYQVNFIQNIKIILNGFYFDEYLILTQCRLKGQYVDGFCDYCTKQITDGLLFFCGHFVHIECQKMEVSCVKCLSSEIIYLQQIEQKQKQRLNKLTNIDKNRMPALNSQMIQEQIKTQRANHTGVTVITNRAKLNRFDLERQDKATEIMNLRQSI